jgi:predicted DNA binding CopG/RHH family protein
MKTKKSPPTASPEGELDLIAISEEDGWVPVGDIETQRRYWQEHARAFLDNKRQRVSIMIPERDLARLKAKAAEQGMPYQTLINSILHKYVES